MIMYTIESCQHYQQDLREVERLAVEYRQVLDLLPKRVVVIEEHQAEQKGCPR